MATESKMQIEYIKLEQIKPYENNPRDNSKAVEKVAESIKEFGFKVPIVVDKNFIIVTGHTRYEASKLLNLDTVPIIVAKDLTEKQCKAFRLADNKVSDYSIFDNKKLLEELEGLDNIFTGFDVGEVFNEVLDEKDNEVLTENKVGLEHKVIFKSSDKEKIEKVVSYWESLNDFS